MGSLPDLRHRGWTPDGGPRPPARCQACYLPAPAEWNQPDPCLGFLRGAESACCGHGWRGLAYVRVTGGLELRGDDARGWQLSRRGRPAPFVNDGVPEGEPPGLGWIE